MNLIDLWWDKFRQGKIRYDPNLSVIGSETRSHAEWGTVYYSEARENYKAKVSSSSRPTFDLELMAGLFLGRHGGLVVAANPNSLFEGHLVIYPELKSAELTEADLLDVATLARENADFTFIHNAERSAASIIDWAHFQAYRMEFPIEQAPRTTLARSNGVILSQPTKEFPAFGIRIEGTDLSKTAALVSRIVGLLKSGRDGQRIPVNLIWKDHSIWVVPRAAGSQSELAATYFGGLEIGGIFCMPRRGLETVYEIENLRSEVVNATLSSDSPTRDWFERAVMQLAADAQIATNVSGEQVI